MDGQGRSTQQVGEMNYIVTLEKNMFYLPCSIFRALKRQVLNVILCHLFCELLNIAEKF